MLAVAGIGTGCGAIGGALGACDDSDEDSGGVSCDWRGVPVLKLNSGVGAADEVMRGAPGNDVV